MSTLAEFVDGNCYYAPECKTQEELEKRWGDSVIYRYNRLSCCKIHSALRVAIVEMFTVLDKHGIISFLEAGSALGVVRHNGTQVPWTFDADIGFWIDGEVLKMKKTYEKIITSLVKDLPGWKVIVVHKLDENGLGHCAQFQFVEQSKSAHLDLFGYVGGKTMVYNCSALASQRLEDLNHIFFLPSAVSFTILKCGVQEIHKCL